MSSAATGRPRPVLARVESVADPMVARKTQPALASVSPASLPVGSPQESYFERFTTGEILRSTDALECEFDRIIAEHELA